MHALLIHGAGGGAWEWNVWRRVLEAHGIGSRAVDLMPAAGGLAATRWSDYLAQCEAAFSDLPAPRALVGASLGGLLALALVSRQEACAAVLVNPLPPAPEADACRVRAADASGVIPWQREARLAGTRRALPDADAAAALYAFRRWRDESAAVLREAHAGLRLPDPRCPLLVMGSANDAEVPVGVSAALALRLGASLLRLPGSHVGPLLGRSAAQHALLAVRWLNGRDGFRTD